MLNEHDTQLALEHFFRDCQNFWIRTVDDEREVFERALNDVRSITTDPFSPYGERLDEETKINFIKYREMDLGMRG